MASSAFPFEADERCRFRPVAGGGLRMVLRLTMRCDMACPHCLSMWGAGRAELLTENWLLLMMQFPSIGARKVLLTGGEPLLRTDIVRLVDALATAGLIVDLNSNLQRMTRALMQDLKGAGLSEISVSLEGPEDVHDSVRGRPGAYGKLIEAMGWAEEAGIGIDAACCLTQQNCGAILDLIDLVGSLPIRSLTFSRLLPIGHGHAARQALTQEQLGQCYRLIRGEAGKSIPIRATGLLGAPRQSDCGRGNSLLAMAPDGCLVGCILSNDNPCVPHPLQTGLQAAVQALRQQFANGRHALCWQDGD
jgi:MoaA/NifB/PqqE/SkfB family radical SAM enzyme